MGLSEEDCQIKHFQVLVISRNEEETDEEYVERLMIEEKRKKETEKREHLEYLRLKAKYEA